MQRAICTGWKRIPWRTGRCQSPGPRRCALNLRDRADSPQCVTGGGTVAEEPDVGTCPRYRPHPNPDRQLLSCPGPSVIGTRGRLHPRPRAPFRRAAERRFGVGSRPSAILLTQGYFDPAGSAASLADLWRAPIYVQPLEIPYLPGATEYLPFDSSSPRVPSPVSRGPSRLAPVEPGNARPPARSAATDPGAPQTGR
jgi:hypothetical protein